MKRDRARILGAFTVVRPIHGRFVGFSGIEQGMMSDQTLSDDEWGSVF